MNDNDYKHFCELLQTYLAPPMMTTQRYWYHSSQWASGAFSASVQPFEEHAGGSNTYMRDHTAVALGDTPHDALYNALVRLDERLKDK